MYVAIDPHKRDCHAAELNNQGELVSTARFPSNLGPSSASAKKLPAGCTHAPGGDLRRQADLLASPRDTLRREDSASPRGAPDCRDEVDSGHGRLLRAGRSPADEASPRGQCPVPLQSERRQLIRHRIDFGKKSRLVKDQIHARRVRNLTTPDFTEVFGVGG